jgi:anti-sigma factor RsiW
VGAQQEDQLVAWLSKRLEVPVRRLSLAALGYELVGGRCCQAIRARQPSSSTTTQRASG